jgi:ABC-type uncharacterized transport system auxiliary subunit
MPDRRIIAETTVGGETRAVANTIPDVVHAFDGALGAALHDLVAWTVRNPALSHRRR